METERLFAAAKELIGARTDYPFEGDRDTAVFRHGAGKWFGICLYVPLKYFGEGVGSEYCLNLKRPTSRKYCAGLTAAFCPPTT